MGASESARPESSPRPQGTKKRDRSVRAKFDAEGGTVAYYYTLDWNPIIEEVKAWSEVLRTQLYACVQTLAENPDSKWLGVRPLKLGTHAPGGWFSAPFDRALLIFERMADYPHIRLDHVTWLNGGPPA